MTQEEIVKELHRLGQRVTELEAAKAADPKTEADRIIANVAKIWLLNPDQLKSRTRRIPYPSARATAADILLLKGFSADAAAQALGFSIYSVRNARSRVKSWLATDKRYKALYDKAIAI